MSLNQLNQELKEKNLIGYWTIPNTSTGFREPEPNFGPFLWKWREIHDALHKAVQYIRPEEAFRRFIGFQHPALKLGTAHTLLMGAQMVCPGEFAPAHRHTMEAIRFVVKGQGAATVVEGEPLPMEPGDLLTTPNWSWHDHINSGDAPIIWLDGANGPMIHYYQIGFANPFDQPRQNLTKPAGWSQHTCHALRPRATTGSSCSSHYRPPYRYAWEETRQALESQAERPGDPFDGVLMRYVDPLSGGPTLPTMSCEVQLLRPSEKGRSHRHTYTVVYHAFRGSGTTWVGDQRFDWEEGDSFVVPLWHWHSHENSSRESAILFSINDRPAIEALGFFREEARE
ncbi:MAG: cupin domain-containing protein [Candidatus Binatia bacterium]